MPNWLMINRTNLGAGRWASSNLEVESSEHATSWDDLRFPVTQTRLGSNAKPDFDYTNIGLLFPQNDADEKIYVIAQLPHEWQQSTGLRPHIHYVQDEADVPVFKMAYRWYENGADPTGSFTTISTADGDGPAFTYTSGSILQILPFPEIDGSGIDSVSSILDIVIYREDNVVSGDCLVKEFDIHYEIDSFGSQQEFTK